MVAPISMQTGYTAPVLTTTGAPPVYATIPAAPMAQAAPVVQTQYTQPPAEEQKVAMQ